MRALVPVSSSSRASHESPGQSSRALLTRDRNVWSLNFIHMAASDLRKSVLDLIKSQPKALHGASRSRSRSDFSIMAMRVAQSLRLSMTMKAKTGKSTCFVNRLMISVRKAACSNFWKKQGGATWALG